MSSQPVAHLRLVLPRALLRARELLLCPALQKEARAREGGLVVRVALLCPTPRTPVRNQAANRRE